ncbi:MAG TPA: hypothetical protein VL096_17435 [Pirellulaceae bacterium]|nr:hypothetical protein [Pirellulaceae bacterium]
MARQLPSVRNQQIFGEVRYQNRSHRVVAADYEMSAARVGEIVEQVEDWLQQSTPRWMSVADRQQQVLAVYRQHCDRLDSLCGALVARAEVLLSYDDSETVRIQSGEHTTVTRRGPQMAAQRLYLTVMQLSRARFEATIALAQLELHKTDPQDDLTSPPDSVLAPEPVAESETAVESSQAVHATAETANGSDLSTAPPTQPSASKTASSAPWRAERQERPKPAKAERHPARSWLTEAIADGFNEPLSPIPR